MTDTERAWAAGFWDGEGSTCIDKRHATPSLAVTQCGYEAEALLQRFLDAVGFPNARIYERRDLRPGRDGTNVRRIALAGRAKVEQALELCGPWLSQTKRDQAQRALDAHAERKANYVNYWASRTHCKRGHAFTPENTTVEQRATGVGRHCNQCRRDRNAALRAATAARRAEINGDES